MKRAETVLRIVLRLAAVAIASGGAIAAEPGCTVFEAEVFSVDASGQVHPLFNFAQALSNGTSWESSIRSTGGALPNARLKISVSWEREVTLEPVVELQIHVPATGERPAMAGTARLEKLVWDHLLGPEPFTTSDGKPFGLGTAGFAVAALGISPTTCAENAKPKP